MKQKMLVLFGMVVLVVGVLSVTSNAHWTGPLSPDLINQDPNGSNKKSFWVHRRHPGSRTGSHAGRDPDQTDALAVVIRVEGESFENMKAKIWRYKDYDYANSKYTDRKGPIEAEVVLQQDSENDTRAREKVTLKLPGENGAKVGYISLYRGKLNLS